MTASDPAKALAALLKGLEERFEPCASPCPDPALIEPAEPLLAEFVRSFLVWDAGTAAAHAALKRIARQIVDFNELRVCLPDEIVSMLGAGYPRVQERALRLRAALTELFVREHAVTLQPIAAMSKRDAKAYLDSLEGVPHFVSARVCLLNMGVHAAPVDGRILHRLAEAGVVPADGTVEAGAAALERKIRAGDMLQAYTLLQWWADELREAPAVASEGWAASARGGSGRGGAETAHDNGEGPEGDAAAKPPGGRKNADSVNGVVKKSRAARTPTPRSAKAAKPASKQPKSTKGRKPKA